jgi:hypothetical protein
VQRYLGVALTNPVEGKEAEFNEWYDNRHVLDMLALPGCVSAQRYRLADVQRVGRPQPFKYLALYEIETDDLAAMAAELAARSGTPAMPWSDAVAPDLITLAFVPMAPKIEKGPPNGP